jgi:hypothetical protein
MLNRKRIAALSVLVGGLAVTCAGTTQAYAGGGPGACTPDVLGNLTCTQRFKGEAPEGELPPHRETCQKVEPLTVPAFLGNGKMQLGPEVTCSPATWGSTGNPADKPGAWHASDETT